MQNGELKMENAELKIENKNNYQFNYQFSIINYLHKTQKPRNTPRLIAVRTGLEPATSAVTGRHSNQLNYRTSSAFQNQLIDLSFKAVQR